jgi:hypothetical protein
VDFDTYCKEITRIYEAFKNVPGQIRQFLVSVEGGRPKETVEALKALHHSKIALTWGDAMQPVFIVVRGSTVRCLGRCYASAHSLCFYSIMSTFEMLADYFDLDIWSSTLSFRGVDVNRMCVELREQLFAGDWGQSPRNDTFDLGNEMLFELTKAFHLGRTNLNEAVSLFNNSNHMELWSTPKPQWNKRQGRLLFQGLNCRSVSSRGKNIVPVLDAFEMYGWPDQILCPLPGALKSAKRLKDVVDSLNDNLALIKFYRSDGKYICWSPRS